MADLRLVCDTLPGRQIETSIYHNAKVFYYPDGMQRFVFCDRPIFKDTGFEDVFGKTPLHFEDDFFVLPDPDADPRSDNVRRARNAIFDIAMLNEFTHFITVTIAPDNDLGIDRKDAKAVSKYVRKWLNNHVRRKGLVYVLVPEYHEDGAIHMHGLISGRLSFVDSGTVLAPGFDKPVKRLTALQRGISLEDCRTVYNMPDWSLGYSTAIALYGERQNVAKYITKYITKDIQKIFGNFYYAGGKYQDGIKLRRKPPCGLLDVDFNSIDAPVYFCEQAGRSFKYFTFKGEDNHAEHETTNGNR